MADTRVTGLTALTAANTDKANDVLPIADVSATATKKITPQALLDCIASQAKGKLYVSDGTNMTALTVGSNNQVLTADSAQTTGVKWATPASGGQASDMVYPLDVTIGDYTAPNAAVATSEYDPYTWADDGTSYADQTAYDTAWPSSDTAVIRGSPSNDRIDLVLASDGTDNFISHDMGAGAVSDTAFVLRWSMRATGIANNPVMTIGFSDQSTSTASNTASHKFLGAQIDNTNFDTIYSMTGNGIAIDAGGTTVTTGTGLGASTIYLELIRTGSTTGTLNVYSDSAYTSLSGTASITISSSVTGLRYLRICERVISNASTATVEIDNFKFYNGVTSVTSYAATNVYDANTSTQWRSNSSNNPAVYVDLSGSARDIASIAINLDRTATTETQIKIRCSTDTTFTDGETVRLINVSDFTDDTWRFIPINRLSADCRYVQIYGVSNSVVLAINEIKVYYSPTTTDWNRKHFHKYLDPTSTSANTLDSN